MQQPAKAYVLMTWEDLADGLTLFPLGIAYTEERARAVAEIHGRVKATNEIETGDDEPPVLTWQEQNVEGHTHLMHEPTGLSVCYFQELVAFLEVEPEATG